MVTCTSGSSSSQRAARYLVLAIKRSKLAAQYSISKHRYTGHLLLRPTPNAAVLSTTMTTFDPDSSRAQLGTGPLLLDPVHVNRSDLISSVRQLVGSVTANLKLPPSATHGIEEAMARLEATDENFNR